LSENYGQQEKKGLSDVGCAFFRHLLETQWVEILSKGAINININDLAVKPSNCETIHPHKSLFQ
jgi:hypothetical protein